mmetsp:Transcript_6319/g.15345  ORF Transcript_6319/g.15345 Transcript_6319/m.15345 type:complete len:253 (-) Transcript_6319:93-851(-)
MLLSLVNVVDPCNSSSPQSLRNPSQVSIEKAFKSIGIAHRAVRDPPTMPPKNPSTVFAGDILRIHNGGLFLPNNRPAIRAPVSAFHTVSNTATVLANESSFSRARLHQARNGRVTTSNPTIQWCLFARANIPAARQATNEKMDASESGMAAKMRLDAQNKNLVCLESGDCCSVLAGSNRVYSHADRTWAPAKKIYAVRGRSSSFQTKGIPIQIVAKRRGTSDHTDFFLAVIAFDPASVILFNLIVRSLSLLS